MNRHQLIRRNARHSFFRHGRAECSRTQSPRMPTPFSPVDAPHLSGRLPPVAVGIAVVGMLLAAGLAWLFSPRSRCMRPRRSRLEADRAVHPVEAPIAGRVVATHGTRRTVRAGDVLVELERERTAALEEERSRSGCLLPARRDWRANRGGGSRLA